MSHYSDFMRFQSKISIFYNLFSISEVTFIYHKVNTKVGQNLYNMWPIHYSREHFQRTLIIMASTVRNFTIYKRNILKHSKFNHIIKDSPCIFQCHNCYIWFWNDCYLVGQKSVQARTYCIDRCKQLYLDRILLRSNI